MTRRRIAVTGGVVVAVAVLAWASFVLLGRSGAGRRSPLIGRPAPDVALPQLEGPSAVRLAPPGTVTVINFWAPWCVPCLGEHRMLNRVAGTYPADEVRFVAVAYQSQDADVTAFLDRVGRNVPTLTDEDGLASIDFGVTGVPETFVVDRSGIVRAHVDGALTQAKLAALVDPLLAARPAG